ncbi:MAG: hypothetical protein HZA90_05250 [Verrucomicrobia bacterium]|nr:hypothetical protein [Verrucomicrobiota bacterium]
MKKTSELTPRAGRLGLLLAATMLASALTASADQPASKTSKPYPLKKCVVDGKKLGKSDKPYAVSHQGQEVQLCCPKCLPKFEQHSAKYLAKISRAQQMAAQDEATTTSVAALDDRPGGLAWPGW